MSDNQTGIQTHSLSVIDHASAKTLVRHPHGSITLTLILILLHHLTGPHVVAGRYKLLISFCSLDVVSLDGVVVGHSDCMG